MAFHPNISIRSRESSFSKHRASGLISEDDEALIREYVAEYHARRQVKEHRIQKTVVDLIQWRRFLVVPFREATIQNIYTAVSRLDTEPSMTGRPHKQNTKHDKIQALRRFMLWLIQRGISTVDPERIREIRVPERDRYTTRPEDLVTPDEVRQMMEACKRSRYPTRDRAIIVTQYESMARIGEIGRLTWSSLKFDEHGVMMTITDEKTKKLRYVRLVMATEYLQRHLEESQARGHVEGLVFLSERGHPMTYPDFESMYKRAAKRAGIKKRVHSHLMRKSRITELMKKRRQESIIKKMAWGNVTTREWETYAVLCSQDIDDEVLDMYGIRKIQDAESDPLAPIQCEKCLVINPPTAWFCIRCRAPLTDQAKASIQDKEDLARQDPLYQKLLERQNKMMQDLAREMGLDPDKVSVLT